MSGNLSRLNDGRIGFELRDSVVSNGIVVPEGLRRHSRKAFRGSQDRRAGKGDHSDAKAIADSVRENRLSRVNLHKAEGGQKNNTGPTGRRNIPN